MRGSLLLITLCITNFYAQNTHRFAIHGDIILGKSTNFYTSTPYRKLVQPSKLGIGGGLLYDLEFKNNFGLRSGLDYIYARREIRTENTNNLIFFTNTSSYDRMLHLNSIQVPLNTYYKFDLPYGGLKLFVGAVYQIHLNGNFTDIRQNTQTSNILINQSNTTTSITEGAILFEKVPNEAPQNVVYHKRTNLGIDIGIAYEYKKYMVEFKYVMGLMNQYALPKNKDSNIVVDKYTTSTFALGLGYFLK